jgi:nucleoid-associated protein YgaU
MDRFEQLKNKYASALRKMDEVGVRLENLHVQDDKLFVKGMAPSDAAKNAVWDVIKIIDASYSDLTCDLRVDSSIAPKVRTHTVQAGDTLSKIAKTTYGDANKYMKIFEANKDKLTDPNLIKVGQVLNIPE